MASLKDSMPSALVLAAGATLASMLLAIVRVLRSHARLKAFPGPPLAGYSKLWMLKCLYRKDLHLQLKAACDRYGECAQVK